MRRDADTSAAAFVLSGLALAVTVAIGLAVEACGGGSAPDVAHVAVCPPSAPLSEPQRAVYADVQDCTGLAAEEPRVRYEENAGGCRLARHDRRAGEYLYDCHTVVLTAGCADEMLRHEMIHALKWQAQGDLSHGGAEWACA